MSEQGLYAKTVVRKRQKLSISCSRLRTPSAISPGRLAGSFFASDHSCETFIALITLRASSILGEAIIYCCRCPRIAWPFGSLRAAMALRRYALSSANSADRKRLVVGRSLYRYQCLSNCQISWRFYKTSILCPLDDLRSIFWFLIVVCLPMLPAHMIPQP